MSVNGYQPLWILRLSGRVGFPVCSNGSSKYTRTLPVRLGVDKMI